MKLRLTVRDLEPGDLADLDWSGGPEHLRAVAAAMQASYAGEVGLVVAALENGRLAGMGAVDFRPEPGSGLIWMLAVHEVLQGLGIGTRLIRALERRTVQSGRSRAGSTSSTTIRGRGCSTGDSGTARSDRPSTPGRWPGARPM